MQSMKACYSLCCFFNGNKNMKLKLRNGKNAHFQNAHTARELSCGI